MENCRLCGEAESAERSAETRAESPVIWSGRDCRVILVNDPELPGFCRVIWHQHVAEMSGLNHDQRNRLMRVVVGVEEAISRCMAPAKINLASLGNQVPHLHWHVIPRYEDDPFFPDSIWSARRRRRLRPIWMSDGNRRSNCLISYALKQGSGVRTQSTHKGDHCMPRHHQQTKRAQQEQ